MFFVIWKSDHSPFSLLDIETFFGFMGLEGKFIYLIICDLKIGSSYSILVSFFIRFPYWPILQLIPSYVTVCFKQIEMFHFYPCLTHLCSPLLVWLTLVCFQLPHYLLQEVFLECISKLSLLGFHSILCFPLVLPLFHSFYFCISFLCFLSECRVCVLFTLSFKGSRSCHAHCRF